MTMRARMPYIDVDDVLAPAGWASAPKPPLKGVAKIDTLVDAHAALEEQANKTVAETVEQIARFYALCPSTLDLLDPHAEMEGRKPLSHLTPHQLCDRLSALVIAETDTRRPLQIGGNVQLLNLRAAMRYAERLIEIKAERP